MAWFFKFQLVGLAAALLLLALAIVGNLGGYCIVETHSVPAGLWQAHKVPIRRGVIVRFCPPDTPLFRNFQQRGYIPKSGSCPGNFTSFLKPVAALPGDTIVLSQSGVSVNGQLIPNSRPMRQDPKGRPITPYPAGTYHVPPNTVWLVSHYHPASLDARYFGPLPIRLIQSPMHPVWVEKTP